MHKRKMLIFLALAAFVVLGVAAVKAPHNRNLEVFPNDISASQPDSVRNLKILPKDISDAKLDSIMNSYTIALGQKCNFCHVPFSPITPDKLNYASDADPMKEEARKMMRMTIEINKTNFYHDKNERPEYLKTVTCKTCHRGEPFPPEN